jgi:hypothetical protein
MLSTRGFATTLRGTASSSAELEALCTACQPYYTATQLSTPLHGTYHDALLRALHVVLMQLTATAYSNSLQQQQQQQHSPTRSVM